MYLNSIYLLAEARADNAFAELLHDRLHDAILDDSLFPPDISTVEEYYQVLEDKFNSPSKPAGRQYTPKQPSTPTFQPKGDSTARGQEKAARIDAAVKEFEDGLEISEIASRVK